MTNPGGHSVVGTRGSERIETSLTLSVRSRRAGVALGGATLGHHLWNRSRFKHWDGEDSALANGSLARDGRDQRQLDNNQLGAYIDRAERMTVALGVASGAFLASGVTLIVVRQASRPEAENTRRESSLMPGWSGAW